MRNIFYCTIFSFSKLSACYSAIPDHTTITRDVAIFGGGASGSFAAIQLRDAGKSVVVVEGQDHLGGHSHAFHDPVNGASADFGVQLFQNVSLIQDFYGRYSIPLKPAFGAPGVTVTADFLTGHPVDLPVYTTNETVAAFARYSALEVKYSYLDDGVFLPEIVPDELLLPFNVIVTRYSLQPLVPTFNVFLQGWPDFDHLLFVYVLRYVSKSLVYALETGTLVRSATNDNGQVYRAVQTELGPDALLSSTVVQARRSTSGGGYQQLWVRSSNGTVLVRAKKILVSVPTVLENMGGFDLDLQESSLFRRLRPMNHWTGLLRGTDIPQDTTITNSGENTTFHSIQLPGSSGFTPTADSLLHGFVYTSYEPTSESETKHRVLEELQRLRSHHLVNGTNPQFAAIKHHSNYAITVSAKDIKNGFYRRLYALQGHRATYYTGAQFAAQGTVPVFNFTVNHVLPLLLQD
ncbi:hypothetical protein H2203_001500 [Taxawa tesnikishii (nom. ined.)]|nr:hypothetical protein H2203_001500 [Dothideales sp. JES 119]